MINIQFQLSGVIILGIITLFYLKLKRIDLKTQRVFFKLLLASDLCAVLDIVSVFMIAKEEYFPSNLTVAVSKVYLCMLVVVTYYGLLYICSDIYVKNSEFRRISLSYRMILLAACGMIFLMPLELHLEGRGEIVYTYGLATVVTYVAFGAIFLAMLIHLIIGRSRIHPRRRNAVYVWLVIWLGAALLQFVYSHLLVVTYAGVIGVLIIFIVVENPESNMDKRSGSFNISALQQYAYDAYANNRAFSMLIFSVYGDFEVGDLPVGSGDTFVGGGVVYLMYRRKEEMEQALKAVEERFPKKKLFVIPDSLVVPNTEELFAMIRTFKLVSARDDKERICYVDESYVRDMVEKHRMELILKEAMDKGRVEVYYQPIYSTREKRFASAEALVRIRDAKGEIVPPGKFIPVAEESGYIVELGKMILDKVFAFMKLYQQSIGLEYMEINLSVVQGEDKRLSKDVMELLGKYELPPECIVLEITESASVQGKEQLLNTMNTLIENSIEFALDDFGTGQSNLDYMASMPVKIVKFDKNMTKDYFTVDKTRMIMDAAIQMIHDMGMEIVAEGIETAEQLEGMLKQGVEHIQGYYFSKPLPEETFIRFMKAKQ